MERGLDAWNFLPVAESQVNEHIVEVLFDFFAKKNVFPVALAKSK